jgi:outer membrane immunogenic protein
VSNVRALRYYVVQIGDPGKGVNFVETSLRDLMALISLSLLSAAAAASALNDSPWDGFYGGLSVGGASNSSCSSGAPAGALIDAGLGTAQFTRSCPSGGLVGGLQFGENFQYKRFVWGLGADIDVWSSKNSSQSLNYTAAAPPPGTYVLSGKLAPSRFVVIGPRIGYGGNLWMPYVRAGAVISGSAPHSSLSFTPAGAAGPTASFGGGKEFSSTGWAAGGGTEIGLNGAWSITAEFLHVNLGKGSDSATTCSGVAPACAAFSGVTFNSVHSGLTANLFRIGINHYFNYWDP